MTDVQARTGAEEEPVSAGSLLRPEGNGAAYPLVEALAEREGVPGVALGRRDDSTE
ncbi:hypothetical protein [Streptomyces sp. NPDC053427]|uniref:hypothetical protein n=1 Tax=Streptomyces sp. NPDC053427 TaxID=3365701 RepID=UPI0037CEE46E